MWDGFLARFALVIGSSAVLGAAACGGSDFSNTANSLCAAYQAKASRIPKPTSPSEIPRYADRALPGAKAFMAKMNGLTPPGDQRAIYRRYLAGGARHIALLAGTSAAIRSGDSKHAAVLSRHLTAEVERVDATAGALGLKQCARS